MNRSLVGLLLCAGAFAQSPHEAALKNLHFRSIGPAVMGGRIDDFAVVDSDPRIIYVGTAASGILKSVNGGVTWTPIFDDQTTGSIGDIALAPSDPSILYVGTGEPNNRQSSSWGNGVYKSLDAGRTWQFAGLKDTRHIGRIAVHPTDPNIAYVAALGDLWGPNSDRGVFKTTDGGATWTKSLYIDDDTGISDVAIDPQSPNIVFAAAYERRRTVFGYNGGGPKGGMYRSLDGGAHWTRLTKGLPTQGDIGRCAVDISRKNPNIVYVLFEHMTQGGIYRSEDKGETFVKMSDTNPRPSYYSQVRIDPSNENKVWVLGAPLYLSEDGGRTFTTKERGIHTDFHAFWIDPANSDHVLAGSDGGITVSWDSGRTWDYVNNFPVGQFYEVTYDFQHPYHVCGGLQDNNTWCGPSASLTSRGPDNGDWIQISGGDGFHARIDPKDPDIVYSESQDGNLQRRVLSTGVVKSIRPQEDSVTAPRFRFQWNSPLIISAFDNKTIYYGGNYLFKSTDRGDTWERLGNKDLTNNEDRNKMPILGELVGKDTLSRNDGVVSWPCITAIAESPVKPGILWAGTDDGNLQVSRDGGKSWTNVAGKVPGVKGLGRDAYVSRIETSYKEEGTAYVAFDNHRSADYSVYVYMTRDFGSSWSRITEGIPQEAGTVHVVREDPVNPDLLFAGTEFGLYVTFNRGRHWEKMTNGLPTVPVFDLQIHPREHDLILATHGRSIWIMDDITPLEEMSDSVLSTDLKLFTPLPGTEWRTANYRGFTGSREFIGENPPAGVILNYYAKSGGPVRVTVKDAAGKTLRTINARAQAGVVNRVDWDLRMDNPLPNAFGGRGGRGGRGGAAAEPQPGTPEAAGAAGGRGSGGGFGGFGGRGGGAAMEVDPGQYTITVALAGKSDSKTIAVSDDPRVPLSEEARVKRKAAVERLISLAKEATQARNRIVAMQIALTELTDGWKRPGAAHVPANIQTAANNLLERVKKAATPTFEPEPNDEPRLLGFAGAPLKYNQPPVTQQLTRLIATVGNYPAAPTSKQVIDIDQAEAELKAGLAAVNQLDGEVPKLNKMMADAGIPYFTVDPSRVPPPTGGRGGEQ